MSRLITPQTQSVVWRPMATDLTQTIFIADANYLVTAAREVHGVVSVSGTLMPQKLTGTTAPGSGLALLSATFDLTMTAHTVTSATLTSTMADRFLVPGDRIGGVLAGTLTGLLGCVMVITLQRT